MKVIIEMDQNELGEYTEISINKPIELELKISDILIPLPSMDLTKIQESKIEISNVLSKALEPFLA